MKKSRFSEYQIYDILGAIKTRQAVKDVCREHGISCAICHAWKGKFGGLAPSVEGRAAAKFLCGAEEERLMSLHRGDVAGRWANWPLRRTPAARVV